MLAYLFDNATKEYAGSQETQLDILESHVQGRSVWLLPAWATFAAPGDQRIGYAQVWSGHAWEEKPDHRRRQDRNGVHPLADGVPYWLATDDWRQPPRYMEEIGPYPEGSTTVQPTEPYEHRLAVRAEQVRAERDARLVACDYVMCIDVYSAMTDAQKAEWAAYRQELRDLTSAEGFPWLDAEVPWPTEPSKPVPSLGEVSE